MTRRSLAILVLVVAWFVTMGGPAQWVHEATEHAGETLAQDLAELGHEGETTAAALPAPAATSGDSAPAAPHPSHHDCDLCWQLAAPAHTPPGLPVPACSYEHPAGWVAWGYNQRPAATQYISDRHGRDPPMLTA